jgi:hypothetical protein
MRSGAIGAVLALALVSSAWGYGYLGLGLGAGVFQGSARGGGMGEVGLASEESPMAVALNPALVASLEARQMALVYRAAALDENWSSPVYDSFDAILGYTTYSANSSLYHDFAGGLASGPVPQAFGTAFAVALGTAYDFRYDYDEEVRDRASTAQPPDRVIARNSVRGDGQVRALSLGAAKTVYPGLALGLGLDYLFGDHDVEAAIRFLDENRIPWASGSPDTFDTYTADDLSGTRFTVGASYSLGERLNFAAAYRTETDLDGDVSASGGTGFGAAGTSILGASGDKVTCPAAYSLGVSLKPRNVLTTVVEGNLVVTRWSGLEDEAGGTGLDDTFEWHLGVEHVFYNQRPLRFGFLYRPSPADKETSEAAVTAGTGFNVVGFDIDLAARVGWRDYREGDLFKDDIFGAKLRGSTDVVRDTDFGALVTVTRRF